MGTGVRAEEVHTGSSMTTHEIGHSYAEGHGAAGPDGPGDNDGDGDDSAILTAAIAAVAMASSRCNAECRASAIGWCCCSGAEADNAW